MSLDDVVTYIAQIVADRAAQCNNFGTVLIPEGLVEFCLLYTSYVKNGKFCVVNNTYESQNTVIYRGDGSSFALKIEANEIKWYAV